MITIGVPTYNEQDVIGKCIKSILPQISKSDEIIVVASGCTDNTVPVIEKLAKKHKQIKLITEPKRKGKWSALNIILKKAKGNIIVQTDGDVILAKNAIKYLLTHFKNRKVGAVSGRPLPVLPKTNKFYRWSIMSYTRMHEIRLKEDEAGEFWHVSGYLFAHRKKAVDLLPKGVKGSTDGTMGWSTKSKGYRISYEPKAKVYVKCPLNSRDFINQKARARTGFYQLKKRYGIPPRTVKSELKMLPEEIKKLKSFREVFNFGAVGIVYLISWLKAWWYIKRDVSVLKVWKHIESTKH